MELDEDEVRQFIDENGPVSIVDITQEFNSSKSFCSECGTATDEYEETREEVRRVLRELLRYHEVKSTIDWNYDTPS